MLPPWAYAAAGAALLAVGFAGGWTVQGWRCDAAKTEALEAQKRAFDRQLAEQNTAATEYETDREVGRVEARTRETIVREIYRDVEVPADCEPPAAVGSVLDRAIESANSRAIGEPGAAVPEASAEAAALR